MWKETDILHASDLQTNDSLGQSVAISGEYAIVGAYTEDGGLGEPADDAGAAYIFERNATTWEEKQILHASDLQPYDSFGQSVAISGEYIIVGASGPANYTGAAYIFERNMITEIWEEKKILHASDGEQSDFFGYSVAISDAYAIVGAPFEDGSGADSNTGAAYIFERDQITGVWGEQQILHASDLQANDAFGWSVAISGEYAIVGANWEDGGLGEPAIDAGAAYIFERDQITGVWGEQQILHASDLQSNDAFGWSTGMSGEYAIVGAYSEDGSGAGSNTGAAYIFERNVISGVWEEQQILHASDLQANDAFGYSVGMSGEYAVIGAYNEDGGTGDPESNAGAAYIFERNATTWEGKQILHASDLQADDTFGKSAAISSDIALIGASGEDGGTGEPEINAGAAYFFELQ